MTKKLFVPLNDNIYPSPRTDEEISQRQLLCKDLEVLCTQDSTI